MPVLFSELPYLVWQYLAWFALGPLFFLFWVLELIRSGFSWLFPTFVNEFYFLYTGLYTASFSFAVITLIEFSWWIWKKKRPSKKKTSFSLRHWVMLWFLILLLSVIVSKIGGIGFTSVSPPFWFTVLFLGGFVSGLVALLRYTILGVIKLIQLVYHRPVVSLWWQRIGRVGLLIVAVYPFLAFLGVWAWLVYDTNPAGGRFNVLHAAIKNTCLSDPRQENCPHTLKEISYIEPHEFREAQKYTQMQYVYNPETNQYSLVVRYEPRRAIVFDQRFLDEFGIDFQEYTVELFGKDRLKNSPDWEGPWTFSDWQY